MTITEKQLSDVLSEFARTMVTDFPIQGILDQLVRRIVEIMPITGAGVTLISESTSPHYFAASDDAAMRFEELQTLVGEGPCIAAYRTGEAVSIGDLRDEDRFPLFVPKALKAGLAAAFTFPLCQSDKRIGALDLYRDTPGVLSDDAMVVAQTLANVTSALLLNAQVRAELLDASVQAQTMALHDPLTGLPNRILLLERIQHALLNHRRSGKLVAIFFIDLDKFKQVNDRSGHQAGDDLLIAVGVRITETLRPGDTLARLSGDEFIVVCEGIDEERQVADIADRLMRVIASPFDLPGATVHLSASIGIAFAGHGDDPEQLLHKADIAMYQVKRKGGARHQFIDLDEHYLAECNESLQRDLAHAVDRHELRVEYQPVVRTSDGRVLSLEALVRWDHPDRGPVSPAILVPLAERSGDIIEIGRWVLERACTDRHRWETRTGDEPLVMAVNVSAHQLMADGFAAMVGEVMKDTNTYGDQLCLELTESALMQDAELAIVVLGQLKELGVQVALDDFGTGYSSLSYLRQFPVDAVKIDQSFIADLTEEGAARSVVAMTIEMAHLLHLVVVCEGVETVDQCRQVAALSSDFSQGFHFSRPMTPEMLDEIAASAESEWTIAA